MRKRNRLQRLYKGAASKHKNQAFILVALTFGVVGTVLLFNSHALTPTANVEAESGTLSGNASRVTDSGASGGQAVKFSSSATSSLTLGAYTGGNSWSTVVGLFPNITATSFYLPYSNWGSVPSFITTAASKCSVIDVSVLTKNSTTPLTWTQISNGTYDARLISFIKGLDALPTLTRLSLDQEQDQKMNDTTSSPPPVAPGQTAAQFVAAANHLADLVRANATNGHVKNEFWISSTYSDSTLTKALFPTASKFDYIAWDPYLTGGHAVNQTAASLFSTFIPTITGQGWGSVTRVITETGYALDRKDTFTASDVIAFYNSIPAGAVANNIVSVTWFRDDSGNHPYVPTNYPGVDTAWNTLVNQYDQ